MSIPVRKPCLRIPVKPDCGCLNCAAWRKYLVSVGGCEHPRWAPATLPGKDGYEVCAECGVFRAPSGQLWDANTFELAAYGGLAGTVDKLLPVDEEADRLAEEFEAKRKTEKAYFECEFPGCTTRVGTKIGGKAACLQHVRALTTVGERRESVGLDPKVPPPGMVYTGGTQTGRFSSKKENLSNLPKISLGGESVEVQPVEGYRVVIQTRLKEEEWVRDLVKAVRGVVEGLADKTLISVDRIHTDPDDGYVWTVPVDPLKLSEAIGGPSVVDRLADPLLARRVVKVIDGSTVKVVPAEDDA